MIMLQLMNKSMNPQYGASVLRNLFNRNCIFKHHKLLVTNPISDRTVHTAVPELNANTQSNSEKVREPNQIKELIKNGPSLKEFMLNENVNEQIEDIEVPNIPYVKNVSGHGRKVYFKVYGCQMNVNDTEVVWSILKSNGYQKVDTISKADVILLVTCSIRDNAEQKVWAELYNINAIRRRNAHSKPYPVKIGLLGCMAERLKSKILERGKLVDVIAGPDSYKDLPRLLSLPDKEAAINVVLSFDETYADVVPVRLDLDSTSAYVTIMRGCDNMCTYCIVPFTRGRERSRPVDSILEEVRQLSEQGVKEVTLLGQNVNSYRDLSQSEFITASGPTQLAKGFRTVYKSKQGGLRFSDLLDKVSLVDPEMRIRFTSPHPKDFPDEVLQLIGERPNICNSLHVPAQSGNSVVLERMRRGYTREAYIDLINHIREIVPNVSLSSDFIAGFCGETEAEFEDTLSLIELVKYNVAYLFSYSMREKTTAHRRYKDDVEPSVKQNRLVRMIDLHRAQAKEIHRALIGQVQLVLIEGLSKKSEDYFHARNDGNIRVLVSRMEIPDGAGSLVKRGISKGDYVAVRIDDANSQTLMGKPLYHSTIREFASSLTV